MDEKLVSVIMPSYNGSQFLAASIESVLAQTYSKLELLITDDCSSDDEVRRIIMEYAAKDSRVKPVFMTENRGGGFSRNEAIGRASGRYIAFCDSDDRWFPNKLEMQLMYMREKGCALCCSSYIICNENNDNVGINVSPTRISFEMMKRDNKIGCLTAVYDVKMLGRKYFMPTIRKRQDWALFLTILKDCRVACGLIEPLAYYRNRAHSVSSNKLSLIKYNVTVYHDILKFSWMKSYAYFFFLFLPTYSAKIIRRRRDRKRILGKM